MATKGTKQIGQHIIFTIIDVIEMKSSGEKNETTTMTSGRRRRKLNALNCPERLIIRVLRTSSIQSFDIWCSRSYGVFGAINASESNCNHKLYGSRIIIALFRVCFSFSSD